MELPRSFLQDGFESQATTRTKRNLPRLRRPGLLICTQGESNTGKTEFILSCPGPGVVLAVDRGYDTLFDNPNPPEGRRGDFAFKEFRAGTSGMGNEDFKQSWADFYQAFLRMIRNPDVVTGAIDGDTDTWEWQRLAFFGKVTQVPSIKYVEVNAERRAMLSRAYDSGKIIIATNKVKPEYVDKVDALGRPELGNDNKPIRIKSGKFERQGYDHNEYLYSLELEHFSIPAGINKLTGKEKPRGWGIRILKCKSNPEADGCEVTGDDCNFRGVMALAYPDVDAGEWGLK